MKKLPLYITILIGMALGTVLGFAAVSGGCGHLVTDWVKPWGTIFIRMLRLVAVPLVVVSLISGITNLSDVKHLSRLGLKTLGVYLTTTVFAIFIGLIVVNAIQPGNVFPREKTEEFRSHYEQAVEQRRADAQEVKSSGPLQFVVDVIPENVVQAAGDNTAMLQLILLSIVFGVAMVAVGKEKSAPVKNLIESLNGIILKIIGYVMKFARTAPCRSPFMRAPTVITTRFTPRFSTMIRTLHLTRRSSKISFRFRKPCIISWK